MAVFKSMQLGGTPVVSKFEFDRNIMADFVLANRDGCPVERYDIVYGPIANDKVGMQIRKLKDGSIDKSEFLNRLKYMKGITYQFFFGSEVAIEHLKRVFEFNTNISLKNSFNPLKGLFRLLPPSFIGHDARIAPSSTCGISLKNPL